MSARQGVLLGMEAYFRPEWKPRPGLLARFQNYFQGYAAHGRAIYARRKHIAAKLRVSLRTVDRYLAYLTSTGWLETLKRTARTAIRAVKKVFAPQSSGEPTGESIEVKPEVSQNHQTQNTVNAPCSGGEPGRGRAENLPVGYCEPYQRLVAIFDAAGKPRNDRDLQRGHAAFIGIGVKQWEPAITYALDLCQRTASARFIPSIVNFLLDEPWTRVAQERTLEIVTTREAAWSAFLEEL